MGIREELKVIAKDAANVTYPESEMTDEEKEKALFKIKEAKANEIQIEIIMIFIENISNAEHEVYQFVSNISEKTLEELKDLDIFVESIEAIFADETIKSFFKLALK